MPSSQELSSQSAATARQTELTWSKANPAGGVDHPDPDLLVLWNFDVGSAALKPEHRRAIELFVQIASWQVRLGLPQSIELAVTGYSSATGAPETNEALSAQRALAVAALLKAM